MTPALLDRINSVFETCGFLPTLWECWVVFRRKSAVGSTLVSHGYWTVAGIWWLLYFYGLHQFWTLASVAIWFSGYSLKTCLVVRYSRRRS